MYAFLPQERKGPVDLGTWRTICRGSFASVQDLLRKIDALVQHYNRPSRP